jgi:tRNA(fMet)-specific endonuclease VapC
MRIRYLLDTNSASYVIKGNFPRVRERLVKVPMAAVGISAVTEAELRYGVAKHREATRLSVIVQEFLLRVETLPWDSAAAEQYGNLRAALERTGQPLGNLDLMIAAHALALKTTLITHDHSFRRVKGLKIQDWVGS